MIRLQEARFIFHNTKSSNADNDTIHSRRVKNWNTSNSRFRVVLHLIPPFFRVTLDPRPIHHECSQQRHAICDVEVVGIPELPNDETGKKKEERRSVDQEPRDE